MKFTSLVILSLSSQTLIATTSLAEVSTTPYTYETSARYSSSSSSFSSGSRPATLVSHNAVSYSSSSTSLSSSNNDNTGEGATLRATITTTATTTTTTPDDSNTAIDIDDVRFMLNPLNKAKGKGSDGTTCPSDEDDAGVYVLSSVDQICGATLDGGKKYVIDIRGGKVQCEMSNGPLVTDGATLDCNGATIVGYLENYDPDAGDGSVDGGDGDGNVAPGEDDDDDDGDDAGEPIDIWDPPPDDPNDSVIPTDPENEDDQGDGNVAPGEDDDDDDDDDADEPIVVWDPPPDDPNDSVIPTDPENEDDQGEDTNDTEPQDVDGTAGEGDGDGDVDGVADGVITIWDPPPNEPVYYIESVDDPENENEDDQGEDNKPETPDADGNTDNSGLTLDADDNQDNQGEGDGDGNNQGEGDGDGDVDGVADGVITIWDPPPNEPVYYVESVDDPENENDQGEENNSDPSAPEVPAPVRESSGINYDLDSYRNSITRPLTSGGTRRHLRVKQIKATSSTTTTETHPRLAHEHSTITTNQQQQQHRRLSNGLDQQGIRLQGDAVVENCKVEFFVGNGIESQNPPGVQIIYNTKSSDNKDDGILVGNDGQTELLDVQVEGNSRGVTVDSSGDTIIKASKVEENSQGIHIMDTATGITRIMATKVESNQGDGISVEVATPGAVEISDSTIESNTGHGIVKSGTGTGALYISKAKIEENELSGVRLETVGSLPTWIETSVISKNEGNGVDVLNDATVHMKCLSVTENEEIGIYQLYASTTSTIRDTSVADNGMYNIQKDAVSSTMTLTRVFACGDDVGIADVMASGTDLSSVTCDDNVDCGFACRECDVEIPAWCHL